MATDMFLKIEGVAGGSLHGGHRDEIDVLSWSWSGTTTESGGGGRGAGSGKVSFSALSITKHIDKSTPTLTLAMAKGKRIPKATLVIARAGGTAMEYLKLLMNDVRVSGMNVGVSGVAEELYENISLTFSKLVYTYT